MRIDKANEFRVKLSGQSSREYQLGSVVRQVIATGVHKNGNRCLNCQICSTRPVEVPMGHFVYIHIVAYLVANVVEIKFQFSHIFVCCCLIVCTHRRREPVWVLENVQCRHLAHTLLNWCDFSMPLFYYSTTFTNFGNVAKRMKCAPFSMRSIAMCVIYSDIGLCAWNCSCREGWWVFITLLLLAQTQFSEFGK